MPYMAFATSINIYWFFFYCFSLIQYLLIEFMLEQKSDKDYRFENVVSWDSMQYWNEMNTSLTDFFHTLM